MNDATEKEIIDLENKYWRALQDNDLDTCLELTDFPCIITGPQGVNSVDEPTFTDMMSRPRYSIRSFELDDVEVRLIRDDVAVVAYKAHQDLVVEGEPTTLDVADSSTWIKRDGQWRCALHTEAITGDPFGRDRKETTGTRPATRR